MWAIVRFVPKFEIAPTLTKLMVLLQKFEHIPFDFANKDAHNSRASLSLIIIHHSQRWRSITNKVAIPLKQMLNSKSPDSIICCAFQVIL
jgi:hypothetical protein